MGCHGISQLVASGRDLGKARAVIVGEPTSNQSAIAHKGAIYIRATTQGKTAHSSMPELGDNAIYKAAKAILKVKNFNLQSDPDPLLGLPTINVGKMLGGMNINSVPDHAEFSIDIRTTPRSSHPQLLERLNQELGEEIDLKTLVDLQPVSNSESDPFVQKVHEICGAKGGSSPGLKSLPYLTDGSVLQTYYGGVPTLILGPGEPAMAHQTDEYCSLRKLEEAVDIYVHIIQQTI
jgi:succinyl-diaminopimelate desuccinylase